MGVKTKFTLKKISYKRKNLNLIASPFLVYSHHITTMLKLGVTPVFVHNLADSVLQIKSIMVVISKMFPSIYSI